MLHLVSSRSPARPPGDGVSKLSQNAAAARPQPGPPATVLAGIIAGAPPAFALPPPLALAPPVPPCPGWTLPPLAFPLFGLELPLERYLDPATSAPPSMAPADQALRMAQLVTLPTQMKA